VERVELKINGMNRVCNSVHNWKFPNEAHQEERAAACQNNNTPVPGDIAECRSVSTIRTYCEL